MRFTDYQSAIEIKSGDRIKYHGGPGEIEIVLTGPTGDPALDWFLEDDPEGGVGLTATGFGRVFLPAQSIADDEDLEFVSRAVQGAQAEP